MLARAALVLALAAAAVAAFVDQQPPHNGATRDLVAGRLWQSFSPSWASDLVAIEVYLGVEGTCATRTGTLALRTGTPGSILDGWDAADVAANTISEQTVTVSCDNMVCDNSGCFGWHHFELANATTVAAGETLSFVLSGLEGGFLVGVAPATEGHGGPASLVTSPLFPTKYAQFAFRTHMATDAAQQSSIGSSRGTSVTAATVAPIVLVAGVLVAILAIVAARRYRRSDKVDFDSSSLTSISDSDMEMRSMSSRRINVREAFDEASGRWAESRSMASLSPSVSTFSPALAVSDIELGLPSADEPAKASDLEDQFQEESYLF